MDTRYKFKEVRRFISNLYKDYKSNTGPSKKAKRKCYATTLRLLFMYLWNGISAPFIYPIWYLFRKQITTKIYQGTTWQEINKMIDDNKTAEVKSILKKNGKVLYWLWTYGDLRDPLGLGEIVGYNIPNTFWNRFKENAIRNARFTINFMEFRTGTIVEEGITPIDNRNYAFMHKSSGIGDSPDGIYFEWVKDEDGKWYFIYEDNNQENIFYYGYVGLNHWGRKNGRFEVSYRKTDSSYTKNITPNDNVN